MDTKQIYNRVKIIDTKTNKEYAGIIVKVDNTKWNEFITIQIGSTLQQATND